MSISTWFHNIATEAGVIQVDINAVIAKLVAREQLLAHEVDAFIQWGVQQGPVIQAALNKVTPIISAVTGLVTLASTGNPAVAATAAKAVTGVDAALALANTSVQALDAANAQLQASQAAGNGALVNDTTALLAAAQTITGANKNVAAVSAAAISAATAIQAAMK